MTLTWLKWTWAAAVPNKSAPKRFIRLWVQLLPSVADQFYCSAVRWNGIIKRWSKKSKKEIFICTYLPIHTYLYKIAKIIEWRKIENFCILSWRERYRKHQSKVVTVTNKKKRVVIISWWKKVFKYRNFKDRVNEKMIVYHS